MTVIVLTKNEEELIERCIHSLTWAAEVLVLDSESVDRTREFATAAGARVESQPWLGWSQQRNRGTELATYEWVMFVEADEIVTPRLAGSIENVMTSDPNPRDGFTVDRRGDFMGVLLPNESRPSKRRSFVRLFNSRYSTYDPSMLVHEEVICPGRHIALTGVLLHWRGLMMDEYITVFNRYADIEAHVLNDRGVRATSAHLLIRPLGRFAWHYIARGGYRVGVRGLIHAATKGVGEFIRYAKLWEMQNQPRAQDPPESVYSRDRRPR